MLPRARLRSVRLAAPSPLPAHVRRDRLRPNAIETLAVVEDVIRACADLGLSASTSPHLDAWMLWAGLHGVATRERPGRDDLLRLGPLDRPAMLEAIIRRLARLPEAPAGLPRGTER